MDLKAFLLFVAVALIFKRILSRVPAEEVPLRLEYALYRLGFIKYRE